MSARPPATVTRVAAIQMAAGLADVDGNLESARTLVTEAAARGATIIVLPEFFTSAMAMDDRMHEAVRPVDGEPAQLLTELARTLGITVGGSFLARHCDGQVRNTFVLAGPAGVIGTHNKDLPTMWENCYYVGGTDDGLLQAPFGPVGVALCWELIRSQTARRLRGKVRLLLGGSCWWDTPTNLPPSWLWRRVSRQNVRLCHAAAPTLARLVGAPLVHANWSGTIAGRWMLGSRYVTGYVQHAVIIDASGRLLAHRHANEGAGVIDAEVDLAPQPPLGTVPTSFWLHAVNRLPHWRLFWWLQNNHGQRHYRAHTRSIM